MLTSTRHRLTMNGMNRRRLLGAAVLPLVGCTTPQIDLPPRGYSRNPWALPRVDRNHVIREVVGHRPFRPSGFRVEGVRYDDKLVVHNYGHGGGGISLGWGSSALALRELHGIQPGSAAVLGSGVMGLTSARLLQDAGWEVTIYTRDVARHTTSRVAGGQWAPASVYDPEVATEDFLQRLIWASEISHHAYTSLGGAGYGVRWMEQYFLSESADPSEPPGALDRFFPYAARLAPGEHPFGPYYAQRSVTMMIEPAILLSRLLSDFHEAGGRLVIRNFTDSGEVLGLTETVIFNCTGLGAAALFGDSELVPARGQLVFLPPDPAIDYMTIGGGKGLLYMFPRADVLLLGGTFEVGNYSNQPDSIESERIIAEHQRLFS